MVKVGLLLKKPDSVFSNGCVQQPLFLKRALELGGCEVVMLGIEPDYTIFEQTQEPVEFTNALTDFSSYHVLILASVVLLENENNMPYIENLQKYDVVIVNFICGNIYILHQEEFVFQKHQIMHHYMQNYYHMNWIMEMYDYCEDYLRIMSNKPTEVVPYLWDPDIVQNYVSENHLLRTLGSNTEKINIMIFEANMSIHKNSLIPLLICEEFHRKFPGKLNKVYVFCCEKLLGENSGLVRWLSIFKDKKVEVYGRIVMPYIVDVISKNNDYLSVMLSYTLLNRLNFIHLEMMHLGIPIVHNCKPFEMNGNYFEDHDLRGAAVALERIRTTFVDANAYKEACAPILKKYSATDSERVETYKGLVDEIVKRFDLRVQPPPTAPRVSEIEQQSFPVFKSGEGVQLLVSNSRTLGLARSIMRDWKERLMNKCVEIAYAPNIDSVLVNEIKNDVFHNVRLLELPRCATDEDLENTAGTLSSFEDRDTVNWTVYANTKDSLKAITRS
jgi:hypothetical protein